ncbi:hypothetical protein G8346_10550 [Thioalkalivibrio sp. XN279]|nr:hypothetical protein [Thioalkalivibrio sp. XN279]
MKWLPWRFIIRRVARRQGFIDPIALLARLHSFAQPSEVGEPIELLRAGVVFHARGLINSRVIQHNLDWVWPYWIERQFNPRDVSFIPRAFSITHVNLSHRNWTAVGLPDCDELPIVDPRGLLTPFLDGWSLDGWLLAEDGRCLLPSRQTVCTQRQLLDDGVRIDTETTSEGLSLASSAWVALEDGQPVCKLRLRGRADTAGHLVLALRPQNPEGVSFIHALQLNERRDGWRIDDERSVTFDRPVARHHVSDYRHGDVYIHLQDREDQSAGRCDVGMVTAAAMFPLQAGEDGELTASIPLGTLPAPRDARDTHDWAAVRRDRCRLECPEPRYRALYDAALTSLVLHSPEDVYPGPYTYKRFWFRDAAFIIHALLCAGYTERAERALAQFHGRQTALGYFRSQEGEWDANGEVLWIFKRFSDLAGRAPAKEWHEPIRRGARWIMRKRLDDALDAPHAGLLPAGFSAEHLGPNDYYYWDDFWGVAGLEAAAAMLADSDPEPSADFAAAGQDFMAAIERSLARDAQRLRRPAMPASPYRRMDAGAIGSLAIGYPAQLCPPDDPRLLDTVEFLLERCFVNGAFYQDMIHSGLNAYLTLHVAQVLLRAGDPRYLALMDTVAALASPTGQWPEAIHPQTGGGCMGDGHHVWAAAEWVLMLRNCFLREEGERLVLCAGVPARWLDDGGPIRFGPAPTTFGTVSVEVLPEGGGRARVRWQADWHADHQAEGQAEGQAGSPPGAQGVQGTAPPIDIELPGFKPARAAPGANFVVLEAEDTGGETSEDTGP